MTTIEIKIDDESYLWEVTEEESSKVTEIIDFIERKIGESVVELT